MNKKICSAFITAAMALCFTITGCSSGGGTAVNNIVTQAAPGGSSSPAAPDDPGTPDDPGDQGGSGDQGGDSGDGDQGGSGGQEDSGDQGGDGDQGGPGGPGGPGDPGGSIETVSYSTAGGGGTVVDLADAHYVVFNTAGTEDTSASVTIDGEQVPEYSYTWKVDLTSIHNDVPDSPAEYYEGTAPNGEDIYIAHDIYYLPDTLKDKFTTTVRNDDITEIACYYDNEVIAPLVSDLLASSKYSLTSATNFIFATLPNTTFKDTMLHSEEEAFSNPVLHINRPGTFVLSGTWNGQIWIDGNGDDSDPSNTVNIVLNGADVTCSVAPAIIFHDVYECGPDSNTSYNVDISGAGAKVYIADGTTNTFTGSNVYRILKVLPKNKANSANPTTIINGINVNQQKKRLKIDGAFYSYASMLIDGTATDGSDVKGTGVLNIESSSYEGLDVEMHLAINGGIVNIATPDDGINVNEDNVSVFMLNNGSLNICSNNGDGIDSNGWLVINNGSGTITSGGPPDHGLDSQKGTYILGGSINADTAEHLQANQGTGKIGAFLVAPMGILPGREAPRPGFHWLSLLTKAAR